MTIVSASATALLLGAALADPSGGGGVDTWVLLAAACFGLTVVVGAVWAVSRRVVDPALERAATAEHIAEELRGPLLSLRSLSASGLRGAAEMTDEDRAAFFVLIDEESSRLRRAVEQISMALRIEADGLRYDLRDEDLGALVEEAAAQVPHGEHPLRVEVEPDLHVRVDRLRLGEALAAIVDNASRFSPPDAPIEVRAFRAEDRSAVVEVADHGSGCSPRPSPRGGPARRHVAPPRLREDARRGRGAVRRARSRARSGRRDRDRGSPRNRG